MIFSVILAGGVGERFWPLSKKKRPKQFLSIIGDDPLLSQTKKRVLELTPLPNIKIVTNKTLTNEILSLGFSKNNLIVEPKGMNTLYAIALAAAKIITFDRDAIMLTLPSDHWIKNNKQFISVIKRGIPWAEKDYLVTYGIIPSRVETGYGYISPFSMFPLSLLLYILPSDSQVPISSQSNSETTTRTFLLLSRTP
jgi:mannose-1-phosphate guanylyltransferase